MTKLWWKNGSIYQIYPRSFKDSNNDGEGDLQGIISKLDYVKSLGVKAIWLNPFAKSPMIDNGYDTSDYKDVNPMFGTMKDFDLLSKKCKELDLKIIFDLVPNHCSSEHEWFQRALKGEKKYIDYFFFVDKPKFHRQSYFGGDVWTKATNGKYYFHSFAPEQPDLNWHNPEVVEEFIKIVEFWIDKGVGGFRFDAFDEVGKPKNLLTRTTNFKIQKKYIHEAIKGVRKARNWGNSDEIMTVSESAFSTVKDAIQYTNLANKEFTTLFHFDHVIQADQDLKYRKWIAKEFDLVKLKKVLNFWQQKMYNIGWNTLYFNNHDQSRSISRFRPHALDLKNKAKVMSLTLHGMQGTPYVYQGEEIGMDNDVSIKSVEKTYDVEVTRNYNQLVVKEKKISHESFLEGLKRFGRDNARTPMPWNQTGGFSNDNNVKPWIPYNPSFKKINVESQINDSDSVLNWYKQIIALRDDKKIKKILADGQFKLLFANDKNTFIYQRILENQQLLILTNWSDETQVFKLDTSNHKILLNNFSEFKTNTLKPWQAVLMIKKQEKQND